MKHISDTAQVKAAYGKQYRNWDMMQLATETKVKAERRCGELLRDAVEISMHLSAGLKVLHQGPASRSCARASSLIIGPSTSPGRNGD